ncbi:MAG: membrane protein insertase YidC [Dehalococcoidia bacterium]|nr:membrane protein insertase YidC [Dehalococcoidia bacterium]
MIGEIFGTLLLNPMVNFLVLLTHLLWGSFGLAIIAFTIIIRIATFPLTLRQLHQTRAMQELQPMVQEIQKKYSDPRRRQQELMSAYKEAGVNPIGCLGPMLIQMPVLIALFYAVRFTLPASPEALEHLSARLYDFSYIQHAVPIEETFLGLDLREPALLMVGLVGITSWLQTKTTVSPSAMNDERVRQQQMMMQWMLPGMFAFFALSFPSGVSLYWVVNSIVGVVFNVVTYGVPQLNMEPLVKVRGTKRPAPPDDERTPRPAGRGRRSGSGGDDTSTSRELRTANGPGRSKRQNRRRRS